MSKKVGRGDRDTIKQLNKVTSQVKNRLKTQQANYHEMSKSPSGYMLMKNTSQRPKYSQIYRNPSENKLGNRQEYYTSNIVKRRNGNMVTNLKSELQTLKMQVSRLVNKQPEGRYSSMKPSFQQSQNDSDENQIDLRDYGKDVSDSVSMTSEKIIDEPIRRLQKQFDSNNFDQSHYLQLENDLLKTELRNLKNKYNILKQQWRQKYHALEDKNHYLQISLKRSQQNLRQCQRQLQQQVQSIKFQLSRKTQQQDTASQLSKSRNSTDNQYVQEKMKKLYEQLSQKNKRINIINIQCNQLQTQLQKKNLQLRKHNQLNNEQAHQLQFHQHQNQRSKSHLEEQLSKKKEQQKLIDILRIKIDSLSGQLQQRSQKAVGAKQLDRKYEDTIRQYQNQEVRLHNKIKDLNLQIKKSRQLNRINEDQIYNLKDKLQDANSQIQHLSYNLRQQKQKSSQRQSQYKILIEDTKQGYDKEIQMLKQELQNLQQHNKSSQLQKDDAQSKAEVDIKEKDRHINKWKAQYKLLKSKYDQLNMLENNKKSEMEESYKNFKIFESQNKELIMRNKMLEESSQHYLQKIEKLERQGIEQKLKKQEQIREQKLKSNSLQRTIQQLKEQLNQFSLKYERQSQKLIQQSQSRKQMLKNIIQGQKSQKNINQMSIDRIQRQLEEQDNKLNKYIKQIKNKQILINKLKKQVRSLLENQDRQVEQLRKKQVDQSIKQILSKYQITLGQIKIQSAKQISLERQSKQDLLQQNICLKNKINQFEKQKLNNSQDLKRITLLYNQKVEQLQCANQINENQIQQLQNKLWEIQQFKNQMIKNLQIQINSKHQQICGLRAQNKKLYLLKQENQNLSFDQALKNQIDTVRKLREELQKKNDQVYRVRDMLSSMKSQLDNLKSEADINRLKYISEKKNMKISFEIQIQQLKGSCSAEQKKAIVMQQKIKLVIDQNKKKDVFIQNYIMGKKLPANEKQMVASFLKEYEVQVTGKKISEKLVGQLEQLGKLAKYNANLMREIGQLKEKLTLYQAVSISMDNQDLQESMDFSTPHKKKLNRMKSLMASIQ